MVLRERIELSTSPLPRECSTTELPQRDSGAFCHNDCSSASAGSIIWERHPADTDAENEMAAKEKTESKEERRKRLAAELRAKLARRKAQARARRAGGAGAPEAGSPATSKGRR